MPKVSIHQAMKEASSQEVQASAIKSTADYDTSQHVCLAYVHGDNVDAFFMKSLIDMIWYDVAHDQRLVKPDNAGFNMIAIHSGPLIAAARNEAVSQWRQNFPWADWMLMVDCDMVFDARALDYLMTYADPVETPIIGGLCFSIAQSANEVPYRKLPTMLRFNEEKSNFERITTGYKKGDILEVDATGTAFLLFHKNVIEKIRRPGYYPWFFETERETPNSIIGIGEDVAFCLRAQEEGFKVKVHTGLHILHRKSISI